MRSGQWKSCLTPFIPGETGLHQNYFRDFDPTTGRYIEADPIGLAGGLNLYLYANAAPTMYTDPTGEFGMIGGGIGAGIELGMQAYKNHRNGCDLFDSDNYDFWDVGVSAAVGALGPGWLSVGKTTLRSGGAIRNLSGQLDRAQTANRAAKIQSRISKHDNEILDAFATQGAFQTGKMLLSNDDACTCRR